MFMEETIILSGVFSLCILESPYVPLVGESHWNAACNIVVLRYILFVTNF